MDQGPRYAIYFVPAAESALYRFGSAVLGYDSYTGAAVPPLPELAHDMEEWARLTEEPRRYGFHATLKAPFHLSPASDEVQLVDALHNFVGLGPAAPVFRPEVRLLSGFAAVVPQQAEAEVDALAWQCTTIFDGFRAPMSRQERARRIAAGLNPAQIENLDRWGYPYLFGEFRFHMTLTGRIAPDRRAAALGLLQRAFARLCGTSPVTVDRLALVKQESAAAPFRVLASAKL